MLSIKIFKIFGISLILHWSFVILFGLYFLLVALVEPTMLITSGLMILFLFMSVFLHELSHAVVSKSLGVNVKEILLLPIGGVALAKSTPKKPRDEFLIALAGPLFNFVVVIILLILFAVFPFLLSGGIGQIRGLQTLDELLLISPLLALFYVNLMLGAFNFFIPALPLDGGRIARSLLAMGVGNFKATKWVAIISKVVAVVMFLAGVVFGSIALSIIALFVYFGSGQEQKIVLLQEAYKKIDITKIINTTISPLSGDTLVYEARDYLVENNILEAPVLLDRGYSTFSIEWLSAQKGSILGNTLNEVLKPVGVIPLTKLRQLGIENLLGTKKNLLIITAHGNYYGSLTISALENALQLIGHLR